MEERSRWIFIIGLQSSFTNNDKDILLNPAGMGIGKTLATSKAIKDNYNNYNFFLIANPTAPLKKYGVKN